MVGLVVDDEAASCLSGVGARAANGEGGGADLLVVLILHVVIFALKLGSVGGVDLHRRDVFAGVCLIVHDDGAVVDARRRGRVLPVDDEVHVHEVVEVEGPSATFEAHGHATDLVFARVADVGVLRVVARARVAVGIAVDELVVGALDERVPLVGDFRDGRLNRRAGVVEHGGAVLERDSLVVPLEVLAVPLHVLDVDVGHKACRRDFEQALGFACVGCRLGGGDDHGVVAVVVHAIGGPLGCGLRHVDGLVRRDIALDHGLACIRGVRSIVDAGLEGVGEPVGRELVAVGVGDGDVVCRERFLRVVELAALDGDEAGRKVALHDAVGAHVALRARVGADADDARAVAVAEVGGTLLRHHVEVDILGEGLSAHGDLKARNGFAAGVGRVLRARCRDAGKRGGRGCVREALQDGVAVVLPAGREHEVIVPFAAVALLVEGGDGACRAQVGGAHIRAVGIGARAGIDHVEDLAVRASVVENEAVVQVAIVLADEAGALVSRKGVDLAGAVAAVYLGSGRGVRAVGLRVLEQHARDARDVVAAARGGLHGAGVAAERDGSVALPHDAAASGLVPAVHGDERRVRALGDHGVASCAADDAAAGIQSSDLGIFLG